MSRYMEDLRFFIGAFFFVVGVLLIIQGLVGEVRGDVNLNLVTGVTFAIFSVFPLAMSLRQGQKRG